MSVIVEHNGEEWEFPDDDTANRYFAQNVVPGLKRGGSVGGAAAASSVRMSPEQKKVHAIQAVAREYAPKTEPAQFAGQKFSSLPGDLKRQAKGLVAGMSLPGAGLVSGLMAAPMAVRKGKSWSEAATPAEYFRAVGEGRDRYNRTLERMKADAPIAATVGAIPRTVAEYAIGTKALSAPFQGGKLAAWADTGKLGKFAKWMGRGTMGGTVNTAMGQADAPDASRVGSDFAWGFVGENAIPTAQAIVHGIGRTAKGFGSKLMTAALGGRGLPPKTKEKYLQEGFDIGEEAFKRKFWGTRAGMQRKASEALQATDDKLQAMLDAKSAEPPAPSVQGRAAYVDSPTRATPEEMSEYVAERVAKKAFPEARTPVNLETGFRERVIVRRPQGDARLPARYRPGEIVTRTDAAPLGRDLPDREFAISSPRQAPGSKVEVLRPGDLQAPPSPFTVRGKAVAREIRAEAPHYEGMVGKGGAQRQLERLASEAERMDLTPARANRVKRQIYEELEDTYKKTRAPKTPAIRGLKAQARGLKKEIERVVPEAEGLNKELQAYGRFKDALNRQESFKQAMMSKATLSQALASAALGGYGALTGEEGEKAKRALLFGFAPMLARLPSLQSGAARGLHSVYRAANYGPMLKALGQIRAPARFVVPVAGQANRSDQ